MGSDGLSIRIATEADAPALCAIYEPYVRETAITFEYEPPTAEEFAARMRDVMAFYPYVVAELDGVPAGYAYASAFKGRPAYDWAVETSIYVARDCVRSGVGGRLHAALEGALRAQGILNMYACIAVPQGDGDEYLTRNSAEFHAHLGYRLVGEFVRCGYKAGRWYNMVWMERMIGEHVAEQSAPRPFGLVAPALVRDGLLAEA